MATTYAELHQNIQDTFNEAGVEIISPTTCSCVTVAKRNLLLSADTRLQITGRAAALWPYFLLMFLNNTHPINPAIVDPRTMPALADSNEEPASKANPAINSDMVNPIPASTPTAPS